MFVRTHSPQLLAGGSVQRVHESRGIAEEDRRIARDLSGGDPGANLRLNHRGPVDAAGGGVERVHAAVLAADENSAAIHGRLRSQRGSVRESERPLQLRDAARSPPARPASFAGRKRVLASPPPQLVQLGRVFPRRTRWAGIGDLFTASLHGNRSAEKVGDLLAFVAGKRRSLRFHDSAFDAFAESPRASWSSGRRSAGSALPLRPRPGGRRRSFSERAARRRDRLRTRSPPCSAKDRSISSQAPAPGWRTAWEYISPCRLECEAVYFDNDGTGRDEAGASASHDSADSRGANDAEWLHEPTRMVLSGLGKLLFLALRLASRLLGVAVPVFACGPRSGRGFGM